MPKAVLPEGLKDSRIFTFLVNPQKMEVKYETQINYAKTRLQWIPEGFRSNYSTLTFNAKSAGFTTNGGFTSNRIDTEAYKNFTDFVEIYRTNGRVYEQDGSIYTAFDINIIYNYVQYLGYFNEMSYSESGENSPYSIDFSFTFLAFRIINLARWTSNLTNLLNI